MKPTALFLLLPLLAACGPGTDGNDTSTSTTSTTVDGYDLLTDRLSAAVLSVWVAPDGQVWAVGTDDDSGPLVQHYDGTTWTDVDTGTHKDLWWVWGDDEGDLWMSGAGGRVLSHTTDQGFTTHEIAPPSYQVFGVWGSSATDIWAVASDVSGATQGRIYHYNGTIWEESALVDAGEEGAWSQPFKVWGTGPNDVHVVGTNALAMHYDGTAWTVHANPISTAATLFTVHGTGPNHAVAVGGVGAAVSAHWDGTSWTETSPASDVFAPAFTGVFAHATHGTMAAGNSGSIWWYQDNAWVRDERGTPLVWNYHGAFIEDDGGIWAVGGDLFNLDLGVVMYDGPRDIPAIP